MTRRALDTLPRAQQAGILCGQSNFRAFLAESFAYPLEHDPAVFVRYHCAVQSRRDLTEANAAACKKFDALRTEFDAWRGKIGRPRR